MGIVEFAQPSGFLFKLFELLIELSHFLIVADAHSGIVAVTLVDALHEKLLDGILLIEVDVCSHIGISKPTTGQVTVDAVGAMQYGAHSEHRLHDYITLI